MGFWVFHRHERRSRGRGVASDGAANVAPWRRTLAVFVIAASIGAGVFVDHNTRTTVSPMVPPDSEAGASEAAASASWYCPMVFARRSDPGAGTVAVLNTGEQPVSAVLSVVPAGGQPVEVPLNIPARTRVPFNPGNVVDAPYAATTVKANRGGLAVEHGIGDANGQAWAPCATEAFQSTYFADGSTDNATTQLGLYNPFDEYAIVDISSSTDAGRAQPVEYQGIVIAAKSLVTIDFADQLRRRQWISSTVNVRRGKVVADQLTGGTLPGVISSDPVPPTVNGLSLTLGSRLARDWMFPDVISEQNRTERISVYNPGDVEAEVNLNVRPDGGQPIPLTMFVPPRGRFVSEVPLEAKLAAGTRASVEVNSLNGVDVAVLRVTTSDLPGATGFSLSNGTARQAQRWALPAIGMVPGADEYVWMVNDSDIAVDVNMRTVGDGVVREQPLRIEPYARVQVHMSDVPESSGKAVTLSASAPISVSRELRGGATKMVSTAPAIAMR